MDVILTGVLYYLGIGISLTLYLVFNTLVIDDCFVIGTSSFSKTMYLRVLASYVLIWPIVMLCAYSKYVKIKE